MVSLKWTGMVFLNISEHSGTEFQNSSSSLTSCRNVCLNFILKTKTELMPGVVLEFITFI